MQNKTIFSNKTQILQFQLTFLADFIYLYYKRFAYTCVVCTRMQGGD